MPSRYYSRVHPRLSLSSFVFSCAFSVPSGHNLPFPSSATLLPATPSRHTSPSTLKQPRADSHGKKAKMRLYHPPTLGKTHTYFSRRTLVSLAIAVGVSLFLITSPPRRSPPARSLAPSVRKMFSPSHTRPPKTATIHVKPARDGRPPSSSSSYSAWRIYDLTITQPSVRPSVHPYNIDPGNRQLSIPSHTQAAVPNRKDSISRTTLFCYANLQRRTSPSYLAFSSKSPLAFSFFLFCLLARALHARIHTRSPSNHPQPQLGPSTFSLFLG